ncbi:hypothetical protein ACFO4P_06235 [Epilithonimonas pallida]|uniref:Uncharacterized protein n=1 Tax=Epilithonimonas pallida TaxID=373671 RepID=A0ABY1R868_9FLAO|nr:hypothetical protein [Epilithonimonas pallida]SMP96490.1 hypothetical protein SAMN05421679_10962 [Epilithonimonas pallida]
MSTKNQISVQIPATVINSVQEKLQECRTLLAPFLQGLTPDQRETIFKMGDKTVATVQKVEDYTETNPEFAPSYMDQPEFHKDVAVVNGLSPIRNLASQLTADLSDTIMLAGNEALIAALLYYGSVKEASSKGVATARPIYDDLSKRFSRKGNRPAPKE